MSSSNGFVNLERANPRPIELHRSALTEEEYDYYIDTLSELLPQRGGIPSHEPMQRLDASTDIVLEAKVVTLREARAWLRGRFQSVPSAMLDEIMRLFPSPLTGDKKLTGAQFFAALRLMFHAQNEMRKLDKTLTFKPAPLTFAISFETTDLENDIANKASATDSVESSQDEDVSGSTRIQGLVKKRNEKSRSSATAPASTNMTHATKAKKATATITAPSQKIVPAKRAIDIESEDEDEDEDADEKKEDKIKKGARPAPRTQSKSQGTGLPVQKARRTNAGKRKSDATWEETAAKVKGATGAQKYPPVSTPVTANKTAATANLAPLPQQTIKKPTQYAAPVPMPPNTRVIKSPCVPRSQRNEAELQEEEKSGSDAAGSNSDSEPEPDPRLKAKSKSNPKLKPMSKSTLKSKRDDHDSDDDPNKTKSDSDGSHSDSQNEDENRKKQKTMMPSPSVARRTGKPTVGKIAGSTSARGRKGPKGGRISSDGYPRPPHRNGLYAVSDIIGSRTSTTGAVELQISWQGYPASESSWEPLAGVEHTDAYARWKAMWARLEKKGLRNVQIVYNMKNTVTVNGKNQEQKLVQEVGTPVNEAKWVSTKEAKAMIARIKQAIDDERNGGSKG